MDGGGLSEREGDVAGCRSQSSTTAPRLKHQRHCRFFTKQEQNRTSASAMNVRNLCKNDQPDATQKLPLLKQERARLSSYTALKSDQSIFCNYNTII
eukprot:scaffold17188_cov126-Skeletonema_dohrnii-CCMP3373.AAC.3